MSRLRSEGYRRVSQAGCGRWEGREQGERKERAFQYAKGRPLGQEGIIPGSHELQSPEETDQGGDSERLQRGEFLALLLHTFSITSIFHERHVSFL